MDEVLNSLLQVPGVVGSLVVGRDGLVIHSAGHFEPDPDSMGVHAADMLNSLEASLADRAPFSLITVESQQGVLCACAINEVTYVLLVGNSSANLGRVRLELKNGSKKLVDQL